MEYTEELFRNLADIAKRICNDKGLAIEYINPQKEDVDPVYVELIDGTKFIPTKEEIITTWETLQAEFVPEQEVFPVQAQFDNINSRMASLEAQLNSIKDLLLKINS